MWCARRIGDNIEQMVDAITQVNVCRSATCIQGLGSIRSSSPIGVTGFVTNAGIGFRFGDDGLCHLAIYFRAEDLAQQFPTDLDNVFTKVEVE